MAKTGTTWREKMNKAYDLPCVEPIPPKMTRMWGTGTICVPSPSEVDEIMRSVPPGRLITVNQIREVVARRHGATIG